MQGDPELSQQISGIELGGRRRRRRRKGRGKEGEKEEEEEEGEGGGGGGVQWKFSQFVAKSSS